MAPDILHDLPKDCARCGETKPVAEFHRDRSRPDGYHHWCKVCVAQYNATPEVRARRNHASAAWYETNRDAHKRKVKLAFQRRRKKGNPA